MFVSLYKTINYNVVQTFQIKLLHSHFKTTIHFSYVTIFQLTKQFYVSFQTPGQNIDTKCQKIKKIVDILFERYLRQKHKRAIENKHQNFQS